MKTRWLRCQPPVVSQSMTSPGISNIVSRAGRTLDATSPNNPMQQSEILRLRKSNVFGTSNRRYAGGAIRASPMLNDPSGRTDMRLGSKTDFNNKSRSFVPEKIRNNSPLTNLNSKSGEAIDTTSGAEKSSSQLMTGNKTKDHSTKNITSEAFKVGFSGGILKTTNSYETVATDTRTQPKLEIPTIYNRQRFESLG